MSSNSEMDEESKETPNTQSFINPQPTEVKFGEGLFKEKVKRKKKVHYIKQNTDLLDENDKLLTVSIYGLQQVYSILEPEDIIQPTLLKSKYKISASSNHTLKSKLPSKFKFKMYSPVIFRHFHQKFGHPDQDFLDSLTFDPIVDKEQKFYLSRNGLLIIESHPNKFLPLDQDYLKLYFDYVTDRKFQTALPHYFSYFSVTQSSAVHYCVIRKNFAPMNYFVVYQTTIYSKLLDVSSNNTNVDTSATQTPSHSPTNDKKSLIQEINKPVKLADGELKRFLEIITEDVKFLSCKTVKRWSFCLSIYEKLSDYTNLPTAADGKTVEQPVTVVAPIPVSEPTKLCEVEKNDIISRDSSFTGRPSNGTMNSHLFRISDSNDILCAEFTSFEYHQSSKPPVKNQKPNTKSDDAHVTQLSQFKTKLSPYIILDA